MAETEFDAERLRQPLTILRDVSQRLLQRQIPSTQGRLDELYSHISGAIADSINYAIEALRDLQRLHPGDTRRGHRLVGDQRDHDPGTLRDPEQDFLDDVRTGIRIHPDLHPGDTPLSGNS